MFINAEKEDQNYGMASWPLDIFDGLPNWL